MLSLQPVHPAPAAEAEGNPLASNLLNTVQCPGVRFDPALAARRPRPASAAPAAPNGGAAKSSGTAAAAAKPAAPAASPPGKPSGGAGKKGSLPAKKSAAGSNSMAAMWSKTGEKSKTKAAKAASEEPAAAPQVAPAAPPPKPAAQEEEGQQAAAKGKTKGKAVVRPAANPAGKPAAAPLPASDDSWEDSEGEEEATIAVGRSKGERRVECITSGHGRRCVGDGSVLWGTAGAGVGNWLWRMAGTAARACEAGVACPGPAGKKSQQLLEESESEGEPEAPPAKRGKVGRALCFSVTCEWHGWACSCGCAPA